MQFVSIKHWPMNKYVVVTVIFLLPFISKAQENSTSPLDAYFFSLIVNNIDSAMLWYEDILGFNRVSYTESAERGFKLANLTRENIALELIALKSALNAEDVIPNFNNKTRLVGIFKFGFRVNDFNHWEKHLKANNVNIYGDVVEDPTTGKKIVIVLDPDGNRVQLFEK